MTDVNRRDLLGLGGFLTALIVRAETALAAHNKEPLLECTAHTTALVADLLRQHGAGIGTWHDGTCFVAYVGKTFLAPNRTATDGFVIQCNGRMVAGLHEIASPGDIITVYIVPHRIA